MLIEILAVGQSVCWLVADCCCAHKSSRSLTGQLQLHDAARPVSTTQSLLLLEFTAANSPWKGSGCKQASVSGSRTTKQLPEHCSFPPPRADVQAPEKPSDLHLARLQLPSHHQSLLRPCIQTAVSEIKIITCGYKSVL
jgi:hypothetical protein